MLQGKRIAVVMPAYWAEKTVEKTFNDIPKDIVDNIILVDDCSKDNTVEAAEKLGIETYRNETNLNYGGNVKRCLQKGLDAGADILILLHPDYQYTPKLVPAMSAMLATDEYDVCLASRTSGKGALSGGMPIWRFVANWGLTTFMDFCFGVHHTEYHTGYRAYSKKVLEEVDFHALADDFIFDNEMFIAALKNGSNTCEVTCPTSYDDDASSIPFSKAMRYGIQCVKISVKFVFWRMAGRPDGK